MEGSATPTHAEAPQRWNALKHAHYSRALLLPGDDAMEFARQRRSAYHEYRPQTEDEAELVETLAECRWLRRRYLPVQARFDRQWLSPEADEAGRVCEPVGHVRVHSSTDVMLHRQRNQRAWDRARAQLLLLQRQRRLGLVAGAMKLPEHCYLDTSGTVHGPVLPRLMAPVPERELEEECQGAGSPVGPAASDLPDGGIGKFQEQQKSGGAAELPSDAPGGLDPSGAVAEARLEMPAAALSVEPPVAVPRRVAARQISDTLDVRPLLGRGETGYTTLCFDPGEAAVMAAGDTLCEVQ
jgi:hypothetical protein